MGRFHLFIYFINVELTSSHLFGQLRWTSIQVNRTTISFIYFINVELDLFIIWINIQPRWIFESQNNQISKATVAVSFLLYPSLSFEVCFSVNFRLLTQINTNLILCPLFLILDVLATHFISAARIQNEYLLKTNLTWKL